MLIEFSGKVIKGLRFGRVLGFPTANIDRRNFLRQKFNVRLGVWAGEARLVTNQVNAKSYRAAIVIGPIDNRGRPKLEAHLLNFKGNLYGKKISLRLYKFLRPYKKFKSIGVLRQQIQKDVSGIRQLIFN